jgi:hypothetical protein
VVAGAHPRSRARPSLDLIVGPLYWSLTLLAKRNNQIHSRDLPLRRLANSMNREVTCPLCGQKYQVAPHLSQPSVACLACGAIISLAGVHGIQANPAETKFRASPEEVPDWELRLRQWAIGLMILGLVGLALPLFGLQLHRLRNLGEAQWIVLCAVTFVGCCAFAFTCRRKLLIAGGISGGALVLMSLLAWASFGPRDDAPVAGQPAQNGLDNRVAGNATAPPAAPATRESQPSKNKSSSESPTPGDVQPGGESTLDAVELTGRTVKLLERTRDLLRSVVDVPSAARTASELKKISQERDDVVAMLQTAKPHITPEQNQEIGRLYGEKLGRLATEVSAQLVRIGTIPGANEAMRNAAAGELVQDPGGAAPQPATESSTASAPSEGPKVTAVPQPKSSPSLEFEPLPGVSVALPPVTYNREQVRVSPPQEPGRGNPFTDTAPPGGILVGLRVVKNASMGGTVQAIQPIYQVEDSYILGQLQGNPMSPAGVPFQVLAPPGWAIGQIKLRQGLLVDALCVVFHPVRGKGLDLEQSESSEWIGGKGGNEKPLGSPGAFIVGLTGSYHEQHVLSLAVHQPAPELEAPQTPFPQLTYARNRVQSSPFLGSKPGTDFSDQAPEGGVLVGLILSQGKNWGGALQAVQPVYQVEDRYELGQRHGSPGGNEVRVLARPGYAVGGLRIRSGLVLNALQLVFGRLQGNKLNPRDTYESEWIGSDGGGAAEFLAGGRALAGVFGNFKEDLHGIGVAVIPELRVAPTATAKESLRTWRSDDGKSNVEATLVEVIDDQAVLRRADGRTVRVPLSRLSDADRDYVRSSNVGK